MNTQTTHQEDGLNGTTKRIQNNKRSNNNSNDKRITDRQISSEFEQAHSYREY